MEVKMFDIVRQYLILILLAAGIGLLAQQLLLKLGVLAANLRVRRIAYLIERDLAQDTDEWTHYRTICSAISRHSDAGLRRALVYLYERKRIKAQRSAYRFQGSNEELKAERNVQRLTLQNAQDFEFRAVRRKDTSNAGEYSEEDNDE
jgi:hypothetical protein